MERTFRANRVHRARARTTLVRLVIFAGTCAVALRTDALAAITPQGIVAVVAFCGILAGVNLYVAVSCLCERLIVRPGQLIRRGLLRSKQFEWDDVDEAHWLCRGRGGLRLAKSVERMTIQLDRYEPADRLWLIRLLRRGLPQEAQRRWDLFCLRVAMPLRDELAGAGGATTVSPRGKAADRLRRKRIAAGVCLIGLAIAVILESLPQATALILGIAGGPIALGTLAVWLIRRHRRRRRQLEFDCREAMRRWDAAETAERAASSQGADRSADRAPDPRSPGAKLPSTAP